MHRTRIAALPRAFAHRRSLEIVGRCRDRRIRPKGHERPDQNAPATISSDCSDRSDPASTGDNRGRCRDNIQRPVISARLVGDDAVLAWLRATPDAIASGLARAIATLGIELQRKIQGGDPTGQSVAGRSGSLGLSLQLDQSDDRIAATVSSSSEYAHTHGYGAVRG